MTLGGCFCFFDAFWCQCVFLLVSLCGEPFVLSCSLLWGCFFEVFWGDCFGLLVGSFDGLLLRIALSSFMWWSCFLRVFTQDGYVFGGL